MIEQSMTGQIALVTGGAGGIGAGIARCLAGAGARVILTGRDPARLDAAARALPGEGHRGYPVDVTDSAGLARLAAEIGSREGRLDLLVNNAGFTKLIPHEDLDGLTDDLIDEVFRVNWRGSFACVRALRSLLESGEGGVVVNISSNAGASGRGSNVAYAAAKAGVNVMTLALARALAPKIRVVAVAPGFVDTGFVSHDPSWIEAASTQSILKTKIPPEAIGDAVLAVTRMQFTTGSLIAVDGGPI